MDPRTLLSRCAALFRKRDLDADLDEELRAHIELAAEEHMRRGMTAQQARTAALRAFGGVTQTRESYLTQRGLPFFAVLARDLRYAWRQLRKSPGFAATAVVTLALGIGATTAVFSLVDSILLRPLPYAQSGQLVTIWEAVKYLSADRPYVEASARHYQYWKERATTLTDITLLREGTAGVAQGNQHPRVVGVVLGYTNLFAVLGVQPQLGRTFLPEEGARGHERVAIITHELWRRDFASDPHIVGRSLRLNGNLLEIVGVLPEDFHFPKGNVLNSQPHERGSWPTVGVFVPLIVGENQMSLDSDFNFVAIGRLKPGVTIRQATSELNAIDGAILKDYAALSKTSVQPDDLRAYVQPLQETVSGANGTMLWLLLASVGAVLLIACANLANLQLARAVNRERELSVRTALGATPFRLVSAALCESLLLAAMGGIGGILLAQVAIRLFVQNAPLDLPRLDEVHMNPWVLAFAMVLSLGTGIAFGILPALRSLRSDPQAALQQSGSRTIGSHGSRRTRSWLIAAEVFAATALLLLMGLLDRSLLRLLDEHRGFSTGQVVSVEVDVDGRRYSADSTRSAFDDELLRRLRALPGVKAAGLVSAMPLTGENWLDGVSRTDRSESDSMISNYRWISPGYLSALQIPLLKGRDLTDADRNRKSALISQHTAEALWPGEDPVGKQFRRGGNGVYTVVGVVGDTRSNSLKAGPGLMIFMPYWDNPPYPTFFMVRTSLGSGSMAQTLRQLVWSYDPEVTIPAVRSLDEQVNESLAPERTQAAVLSAFGAAALVLALVGIYGVLSYSVSRRVQEIGVRIALGATGRNIYLLTMAEAAWPVLGGLAGGIAAGVLAGYVIRSLLYGTSPANLGVTLATAAGFVVAAALAAFFPARRAAQIHPMRALRTE